MRKQEVDYIITRMLDAYGNVSDLNITVGKPFQVESSGQLAAVEMEPHFKELTPFQTEIFTLNLINKNRRLTETLLREGSCDLSYILPGKARFRVNIFSQRGMYSSVLRKLETKIPTIQDLKLPNAFRKIAQERNGIVFVTGATGSGKTTSLAAVLNAVNESKTVHVITLEDPVEYSHPHKKCTFNQRELGKDFDTFAHGLRAALRQAPKIILVGEMRDRETVEIGLAAAETGHLVLATLHTVDAPESINRIISVFPPHQHRQIRAQLSGIIKAVISQRLVPRADGKGRVPAVEVMVSTARTRDLIDDREKTKLLRDAIQQGFVSYGMQTFDQSLMHLYKKQLISFEEALRQSSNPDDFKLKASGISSTSDLSWEDFERPHEAAKQEEEAESPSEVNDLE